MGKMPPSIRPLFFVANLTAIQKKDGVVRPIPVSCCLVDKVAGSKVREEISELLAPQQLGYDVKRDAEVAIHAI